MLPKPPNPRESKATSKIPPDHPTKHPRKDTTRKYVKPRATGAVLLAKIHVSILEPHIPGRYHKKKRNIPPGTTSPKESKFPITPAKEAASSETKASPKTSALRPTFRRLTITSNASACGEVVQWRKAPFAACQRSFARQTKETALEGKLTLRPWWSLAKQVKEAAL
jgi:hypothetical protein